MRSRVCCHPSWCAHTVSARSSTYGIHPIWPSEYASFNFGNWTSLPENNQSVSDANELLNDNVTPTACGASGDAAGFDDDDPTCMHTVTPVSLHTCHSGSQ